MAPSPGVVSVRPRRERNVVAAEPANPLARCAPWRVDARLWLRPVFALAGRNGRGQRVLAWGQWAGPVLVVGARGIIRIVEVERDAAASVAVPARTSEIGRAHV